VNASRPRIVLVNPNSSAATTTAMAEIAAETAGDGVEIATLTAPGGPALITTERALSDAATMVVSMRDAIEALQPDALVIAAFGDPGRAALQEALPSMPVVGIGEAAMRAAAALGRYAVVTSTPGLLASIDAMNASGPWPARYAGTFLTSGDPATLMSSPDQLRDALALACHRAAECGVHSIIIGGGPLATAARAIRDRVPVPLVEPVPEAVRLAILRMGSARLA
jgi:allantoin racemase